MIRHRPKLSSRFRNGFRHLACRRICIPMSEASMWVENFKIFLLVRDLEAIITLFCPVKWIGGIQCDLWHIYCWNSMFQVRSRRNSRLNCLSFITHRGPTDEARTLPCMVISCNHVWLHTIRRLNHPGSRIWSAPMLRKQTEKAEKYYNSTATDLAPIPLGSLELAETGIQDFVSIRIYGTRGEIVIIFVLCMKSTWRRGRRRWARLKKTRSKKKRKLENCFASAA